MKSDKLLLLLCMFVMSSWMNAFLPGEAVAVDPELKEHKVWIWQETGDCLWNLAKKYYGEDSTYSARDIISSARDNGDDISLRIMEEVGQYLGHLLANLSVIFFPQVIVLTGGTVEAGQVLVNSCKRQFNKMVGEYFDGLHEAVGVSQVDIQKATMGKDAGIVGAVVPFLSENMS